MQHKLLKLLLLVIGLTSTLLWAQPVTTDFFPVRDNTLYERPMGDLSNGAGDHLFFGQTGPNAGNVLRRAVLAFDFSSIPPGSVVTDAQLSINVNMVPPGASSFDTTLHRSLADWGEGTSDAPGPEGGGTDATPNDATWVHTFFDTQTWANIGGDFAATASATVNLNNSTGTFTFASPELIADVQDMVNTPGTNFGWFILGDETDPMNARRISSRENPAAGVQPLISITFEPGTIPPPPPPQTPIAVPALNPWSLLLLITLIALFSMLLQRNRA